jgi:hypothetical protein
METPKAHHFLKKLRSSAKPNAIASVVVAVAVVASGYFMLSSRAVTVTAVPGQSYMLCSNSAQKAQYLTSPYTYHGLNTGTQQYTVAQYQALPGYGTTLPSLPSYISAQGANAPAAIIYAPGSDTAPPSWDIPMTPMLHFFEGGNYGILSFMATSGSLYIGGSTAGFPLPKFDNGGQAAGISAQHDSYSYGNGAGPISTVASAKNAGDTTVTLAASSIPLVKWGTIRIAGQQYTIASISGSQSGYTITITGGLDKAVAAGAQVHYDNMAGGVTVSYLDIAHDEHNTTGTIYTGYGWTISHNNIHDGYSTPGQGVAVYGGDEGVIEYNCFSRMGNYAANIFGHNNKFRYNEVFETNFKPDPGCGCSGGGKWWGTLNADIVDNAFVRGAPGLGSPIWLDNGNSGTHISGNFFDKSDGSAVHSETGHNLKVENNLFKDGGWGDGTGSCGTNCNGAVNVNSTGGFDVPGSRYNNQVIIQNNQFINNWNNISIWQSGARSCENSGQGWPDDSSYCSGGFPVTQEATSGGQYYFSHNSNAYYGDSTTLDAAASAGATQVLIRRAMPVNDYIGFGADPPRTTTTSTMNVSTLTGTQTINAASTVNFPASGQLRVGTSAAWGDFGGSYTGAILSYTGKTATSFTGVSLVRGQGTLENAIQGVEPYKVTAQTCYANDCLLTITPALTGAVAAGTDVTNAGTCQLYAVPGSTVNGPLAPNGVSYWEGCQWGTRNITISGNTFIFDRAAMNAGTPINGGTVQCTDANDCGIFFQAYQSAGEPPFTGAAVANAMMSRSGLTGCPSWDSGCTTNPLANINALADPPDASPNNGVPPNNIVWANNTYQGPLKWHVYRFGDCAQIHDAQTGKSMPADACEVDFAKWQSYWMQDQGSNYSATVTYTSGKAGDFNNDGNVNIFDLSILLSKWNNTGSGINADMNNDNTVNIFDLSIFLTKWGT